MTAPVVQPDVAPAPLQGATLNDFFQAWLVALTGIPGTLVRPAPQTTPPSIPTQGTIWMAFQQSTGKGDTFPFVGTFGDKYQLQRHEVIRILCSFYDQGTDGQAAKYASLLRDNLAVPQNLEVLLEQGMGMIGCEPEVPVPSLLKERWLYRIDLPVFVSRQVTRNYAVPTIAEFVGQIVSDDGIVIPLQAESTTP